MIQSLNKKKRSIRNSRGYDSNINDHGIIKRSVNNPLTNGVFKDVMDYKIIDGKIFETL